MLIIWNTPCICSVCHAGRRKQRCCCLGITRSILPCNVHQSSSDVDEPSMMCFVCFSTKACLRAGVVVKYVVDGTAQPLATGQTPQQAGYEQSLAFAQYLAHKSLHVDVWDGESLLQVSLVVLGSVSLTECWACIRAVQTQQSSRLLLDNVCTGTLIFFGLICE